MWTPTCSLAANLQSKTPALFQRIYPWGAPQRPALFYVRSRVGAIPQMDSPEEVALINFNGGAMDDGVWYSEHLAAELNAQTANSLEDRRLFATRRYNIETVIAKNNHLYSRAIVTFEPLPFARWFLAERLLKFALLLTLSHASRGSAIKMVKTCTLSRKKQKGRWFVLRAPRPKRPRWARNIPSVSNMSATSGVLYDAGSGSYYVGARESWYPNLNGFGEKALYDLTFKVPRSNVVISGRHNSWANPVQKRALPFLVGLLRRRWP